MNEHGKTIDKTFLSLDTATERGFIHRDYIAHCLRWSHVIKRLTERKGVEKAIILDVGCGRELPLAKTLYSSRHIVKQYHGIDVGPIDDDAVAVFDSGKFPLDVWEKTDICDLTTLDLGGNRPNWVTCFEVLEHVEPRHLLALLARVRQLMDPEGVAFFSTPCWDVKTCAANHVNEIRYEALGSIFEREGWSIRNVSGTFASIADYKDKLEPAHAIVFEALRDYYDVNFLACIFAPFYPAYSRNCLWELSPTPTQSGCELFKGGIDACPTPWGSSEHWRDMALTMNPQK